MSITLGEQVAAMSVQVEELVRRVDKQDEIVSVMNKHSEILAAQSEQIKSLCSCMEKNSKTLEELTAKPTKRWDALINAFISALIAGLIALIMTGGI